MLPQQDKTAITISNPTKPDFSKAYCRCLRSTLLYSSVFCLWEAIKWTEKLTHCLWRSVWRRKLCPKKSQLTSERTGSKTGRLSIFTFLNLLLVRQIIGTLQKYLHEGGSGGNPHPFQEEIDILIETAMTCLVRHTIPKRGVKLNNGAKPNTLSWLLWRVILALS